MRCVCTERIKEGCISSSGCPPFTVLARMARHTQLVLLALVLCLVGCSCALPIQQGSRFPLGITLGSDADCTDAEDVGTLRFNEDFGQVEVCVVNGSVMYWALLGGANSGDNSLLSLILNQVVANAAAIEQLRLQTSGEGLQSGLYCSGHGTYNTTTAECECFSDSVRGFWTGSMCSDCQEGYRRDFSFNPALCTVDTVPPVLTLSGASFIAVKVNSTFVDPGFSASDNKDGDLTSSVIVSHAVDTSDANVGAFFTVNYTVEDAAGNQDSASRTVYVSSAADGSSESLAADSCASILAEGFSVGNGVYWLKSQQPSGPEAIEAFCDMDSGGWMLVARIKGESDAHLTPNEVATVLSPSQSFVGKLSDSAIGYLQPSEFRLQCSAKVGYYRFQSGHSFAANSGATQMRFRKSTEDPWSAEWDDTSFHPGYEYRGMQSDFVEEAEGWSAYGQLNMLGCFGSDCPNDRCNNGVGKNGTLWMMRDGWSSFWDGSSSTRAAPSCSALLATGKVAEGEDGTYWIDPNGGDSSDAMQVYCDMTTDGGGWMMVTRILGSTNSHTGTGSVGVVSSPSQTSVARVSDAFIQRYRSETTDFRLHCSAKTGYYRMESGHMFRSDRGDHYMRFRATLSSSLTTSAAVDVGYGYLGVQSDSWEETEGWTAFGRSGYNGCVGSDCPTSRCSQGAGKSGTFYLRDTYIDPSANRTGWSPASPGESCLQIFEDGYGTLGDTLYYIDVNGGSPADAFQVYCDMTNGGWTLVSRINAGNRNHLTSAAVGTLTSPSQTDAAKLADSAITSISGYQEYRLHCSAKTGYYQFVSGTQFIADSESTIHQFRKTTSDSWSSAAATGLGGYHYQGMQSDTWEEAEGWQAYGRVGYNGCYGSDCPSSQCSLGASKSGTLYVR